MMLLAAHPLVSNLLPEIILAVGASLMLVLGVLGGRRIAAWIALLSLLASLWAAYRLARFPAEPASSLLADSLVGFARMAALSLGLLLLMVNRHVPDESERPEYYALMLFSLAGVLLVAVANDLILLFLALELVSVPTYILVGLSRRDVRAQEATAKYFFLGAFAAALTLYGFSFLYGTSGTMQMFHGLASNRSIASMLSLPSVSGDRLTTVGLLLALGGLAFKIAAVPMHFYVADVYQGAASPMAGFLGFVPKFAGFLAIIRLLSLAGWEHGEGMFWLLWLMAAATMTAGNTLALMQQNVKRMLAYSGVAHSGYILVGLLAGPSVAQPPLAVSGSPMRDGLGAVLFYIVLYGVMNLGAFAALSCFRKSGADGEDDSAESLTEIAGSGRRSGGASWAALGLSVCVLGLMGMPPTGGFLAKFYVFSSALAGGGAPARTQALLVLVVIGVINSAVAAAYYLRIIACCYLEKPADGIRISRCPSLGAGLAVCTTVVFVVFLLPGALWARSQAAVATLQGQPRSAISMPASADGAAKAVK
jgi:NADH-quinone oxidoreductase subunit N